MQAMALFWKRFKGQYQIQLFVLLGMLFILVFSYIPMAGIVIAFKDYRITGGISGFWTSDWNGFKHFADFFHSYKFNDIVRNTLAISLLKLVFAFPLPILFAIMLNEVRSRLFKRFVQTVSYLPHFISWIVVSGIAFAFLSMNGGVINEALVGLGIVSEPLPFLASPDYFWGLAVVSDIWKEMGWWAIIFLAAIAGIDPSLYEAAQIDGASRLKRIRHITLPGIKSAIVVVLILCLGNLLGGGLGGSNFEQAYLIGNSLNNDKSEIIQTYVLKVGLAEGRFAFAAAVDLVQSVIAVVLIFGSNLVSRRVTGTSLF